MRGSSFEMEKVSHIVAERLRARAVTTAHPDADMLTAFSEHTLPERERGRVLEHLAACGDCRDVVALALPENAMPASEIGPAKDGWFTWPRLRWGLATAGVVAIVALGAVELQRKPGSQTIARSYDAPITGAPEQAKTASEPERQVMNGEGKKAAPLPTAPVASSNESKEYDRLSAYSKSDSALSDKGLASGGTIRGNTLQGRQLSHGPKVQTQYQQNQYAQNFNANTNASSAWEVTDSVAAPGAPARLNDQNAGKQAALIPPSSGPMNEKARDEKTKLDTLAATERSIAPSPLPGGQTGGEVARAKPAMSTNAPQTQAQASGAYAVSQDVSNFSPEGTLAPESAKWSINAIGGLQRSMDQGKTWQDIDVNGDSGSGTSVGLRKAMKSSQERTRNKDTAGVAPKPIIFRAVSANGPDVWAGGAEGNLYHSTDSGAHWFRVLPSWRGVDLTGDIMNLQFADPQHGRIVTSSAEIWMTMDGGRSWEKR